MPRFKESSSPLLGNGQVIHFTDGKSFLASYKEIFEQHNYKFITHTDNPIIFDCGANIGLSIHYFKRAFPQSIIYGFEPDPNLFRLLRKNISTLDTSSIFLEQKAVWNQETTIQFEQQGGSSGKITDSGQDLTSVKTIRLRDYLERFESIHFLKLDIEGAEYFVLKDSDGYLGKVDNIFVEYHSQVGEEQFLAELLGILKRNHFRYIIKEAAAPDHPFIDRVERGFDFQVDIFAFKQ
jgi:FkbM family methyltransferase